MARLVFVVARHLPTVYDHLRKQFGNEPNVEVIVDRRLGERRRGERSSGQREPERREHDRRRNAQVDEELRRMGYAFVRAD